MVINTVLEEEDSVEDKEKKESIFKPLIEAIADHFFWILIFIGVPLVTAIAKWLGN